MQCKKALEEARGDVEKALVILRKHGVSVAKKKAGRELGAGTVQSYIHSTKDVGAMVLLSCETDFVAKNDEFIQLAYNIAMHIAAMDPDAKEEELVKQPFIKDPERTVGELVEAATQKFAERIEITEYTRFSIR